MTTPKLLFSLCFLIFLKLNLTAQTGADCSSAILVSSNNCSAPAAYNNTGIAGTINPTCFGGGTNNSMWFKFVASAPSVSVSINGGSLTTGMAAILSPTTAPCTGPFTQLACSNTTSVNYSSLTVGNTYYIVVDGSSNTVGTFQLCVSSPNPPTNDGPCNAITLPANNFCSPNGGYTNIGATLDGITPGCFSAPTDNGVWFKFTATGAANTITINGNGLSRPQVAVLNPSGGSCTAGTWNINGCAQAANGQNSVTLQINNLIPGQVYYVLVDGFSANTGNFQICINSYTASGSVQNDECSSAIPLCPNMNYSGTTNGATPNSSVEPPVSQWSCNGVLDNTVWYTYTSTNPVQPVNFSITTACTGDYLQFEVFNKTSGSPCAGSSNWSSIGCVQNGPNGTYSLSIPASSMTANTTYYIVIDNWPGQNCNFNFTITGNQGAAAGSNQQFCINAAASNLTGASPAGGTWSGPGITNATSGTFNPSVAGLGSHVIYYTQGGCTSSKIVTVTGPQVTVSPNVQICQGQSTTLTGNVINQPSSTPVSFTNSTSGSIPDGGVNSNWNGSSGGGNTFLTSNITASGLNTGWTFGSICLNITHTWDADVIVYLKNPCGQTIQLIKSVGGSGDNFTNTCFTPTATTAISGLGASSAPFSGTWIPTAGAAAWNTFLSCTTGNGTWSLLAGDYLGGFTGTLQNWTITLNNPPNPPTYTWSPTTNMTGSTTLSPTVTPTTTTTYTLSATDQFGCTASAQVTVTVNPLPTVAITPTHETCAGLCNGQATANPSGGSTPYSYAWSGGGTSATKTGLCPGTYTVTVTDNKGCVGTQTITINAGPTVTSTFTKSANQCLTGNSFNFTNTGSTGTYSWTFPSGTPSSSTANNPTGVTWSAAGTYTITHVVTVGTCSSTTTQTIVVYPMPSVSITPTNVNCNGQCTGSASATASGGTSPYTYSWSGGGTTSTKTGLCAGTYTLTVTDVNGCPVTQTTTITQPPVLTASVSSSTNVACNGAATGSATAAGAGGTTAYTYTWSNGATTATATGLTAGTYTVTVKDSKNCTATATVTITQPPILTASTTPTHVSCNGGNNGSATVTAGGGTTGYTYTWSTTPAQTTSNATGLSAGTYTVTVKDANNCTVTASATITQPPAVTATISSSANVSCNGGNNGSATVTAGGGTPGFTYAWSNSSTSSSVTGLTAGTYTVTVTDSKNCTANTSVTITQPAALTTTTSGTAASCNGSTNGTATVTPSGGTTAYSYQWGPGTGLQTTQTATGLSAGTYNVTVTDSKGCTSTNSFTVTQPTAINITLTPANSTCGNSNGSISSVVTGGTSPYSYSWSNGSTTANNTNIPAGSYTVTVTDANSCTNTATANVSDISTLSASISSSTNVSCNGGNNGSATVTPSGGTTPYTYAWSPSGSSGATANSLTAGTYSVTVTDNAGCKATASVTITQPTALTSSITSSTNVTCNGQCNGSATVAASGGTSPYSYSWSGGGTATTKTGLCAGTVTVTITDANGCGTSSSVTITQPPVLSGSITGNTVSCVGSCNGTGSLTVTGGTSPFTYIWSNGENTQNATALCAGTATVTITDSKGCTATANVTINSPTPVSGTTTPTNANCNQSDGQACISASGGSSPYSYQWGAGTSNQTTSCATGLAAGTYNYTITDNKGCTYNSTVTVGNSPGGTATASVTANASGAGICDGTATVSMSGGTSPYTYSWNTSPVQTNVNATGLCAGTYCVTVTDINGCTSGSCITITEPGSISVTSLETPTSCFGSCDGSTNVTVSGGVSPYTYIWSNGPTAEDQVNMCVGTYTVTVTDANSVSATLTITIQEPAAVTITGSATNATCNGLCNGGVNITVTGGTEPYTYNWSNGSTIEDPTGLCAGNYTVTVTDFKNCTATQTYTITEPAAITLTFTTNNATCGSATGSATVNAANGLTPYNYQWGPGASNQTTQTATGLAAGTYNITVTDKNLCTAIGTATVTSSNAGTTSITVDNHVSCNGGNDGKATASMSGGTTPFTYTWSTTPSQNTPSATGLSAGTYSVTITDSNGCTSPATVTITQPTVVNETTSAVNAVCFGQCNGSLSISPSGGTSPYTYLWNDPAFQTTATASGLCAGSYNYTVTDSKNCTKTGSAVVGQPSQMTLGSSTTQSNCGQSNGSATVTVTSGVTPYSYQWSASAGNQTTATATGLASGCYDVTVTGGNSCTATSNICVTDAGSPTVSLVSQTNATCNGTCNGFAQISVSGGNPPYSYNWKDASGNSIGQTTASAFNLCAGTYTGEMTDANGCKASINVTITQPSKITGVTTGNNATCFGQCNGSASITAAGGTSPYTYQWSDPSNQTTATATGLCAGSFTVTIFDNNNCDTTLSVTIGQPLQMTASANPTGAFCNSATGKLCVNITNGVSPFIYQWNTSPVQVDSCATGLTPGTYNVTVTDNNGCSASTSGTVNSLPGGTVSISSITNISCSGFCDGKLTASVSGGSSPYSYLWTDSTGTNIGQASATVTGLCSGTYKVVITDVNGCKDSVAATINSPSQFMVFMSSIDTKCYSQCDGSATGSVSGGSSPYSYAWNDPLAQNTPTATGLCTGTYKITATDNKGCIAIDSVTVNQPSQITLSSFKNDANCGQANGNACVSVSGGNFPYTYNWSSGQTSACVSGLSAGTHNVTVSDSSACTANISILIQNLSGPSIIVDTVIKTSCPASCDGSASISISGGAGNYTINWFDNNGNPIGQTTPTASNLCGTNYSVTVSDSAGCSATQSVSIPSPQPIATNTSVTNPQCSGSCNSSVAAAVTGGTSPYTYSWNDPSSQTTSTATGLCAGGYVLTIVDKNNCSSFTNVTVSDPVPITATTTRTDVSCFGSCDGSATVTAQNGTTPYTYLWSDPNAQTGPNVSGLCAGTYSVTVTDANGCTKTTSVIINQPTTLTSSIGNKGDVSCFGSCNGYAQVNGSGGTTPYSYAWSNSQLNQVASNLCAGNYIVTITDSKGCTSTSSVTINQPSAVNSIVSSKTNVNCGGTCDGQATLTTSGGTSPYSYQWGGGAGFQATATATALCGGIYTVTVTDSKSCSTTVSVSISEPATLGLSAGTIVDASCNLPNGSICVNAFGGTGPFTYQWNDPNTQTGACANNLFAGCYTINITDSKGCTVDSLICINNNAGPTLSLTNKTNVSCNGGNDGSLTFSVTGGTTPYDSISWYNGSGVLIPQFSGNPGSLTANGLTAGTYTIKIKDAAGCIVTMQQTITQPPSISASITNKKDVLCFGGNSGEATVSVVGGNTPYSYSWNTNPSQTQSTATGLSVGSYTVTITDNNNCTKTASISISGPNQISNTLAVANPNCNSSCDGSIALNTSGGVAPYNYNWSASVPSNPTAYGLCAGTYSVTVTDANNCNVTTGASLTDPIAITSSSNIQNTTCNKCNGSATINPAGGLPPYTYNWGTGQNTQTATGFCPGTYQLTITDSKGCTLDTSANIGSIPAPQITGINTTSPLCFGNATGSATVVFTGGTSPSPQWGPNANNQTTITAVGLTAGNYCVTVTDLNGCSVSQCAAITQPSKLSGVPDKDQTICFGNSTQIWGSGSGGTQPYTITWTNASFTGSGPHTINPTQTTSYCFNIKDNNNCSADTCINITVTPELIASVTPGTTINICNGDTTQICVNTSGGNGNIITYTWSNNYTDSSYTGSCQQVSPSANSTYTIIASDKCSVNDTVQVQIIVNTVPTVTFSTSPTAGCPPLTVNFNSNVSPASGGYSYAWDFDNNGTVDDTTITPIYTYTQSGDYVVNLTVTSSAGCSGTATTFPNFITVYPLPIADFTANPTTTTIVNSNIEFDPTASVNADSLVWNFGDGTITGTGTVSNIQHQYNDTGIITITLIAITENGCKDTIQKTIEIKGDFTIFVPTAFTPNGDGKNDFFFPEGVGIDPDNFTFYIFDRWGELIFQSSNINKKWDGKVQGKDRLVELGVYVWRIDTRNNFGEDVKLIGHVTVVR